MKTKEITEFINKLKNRNMDYYNALAKYKQCNNKALKALKKGNEEEAKLWILIGINYHEEEIEKWNG